LIDWYKKITNLFLYYFFTIWIKIDYSIFKYLLPCYTAGQSAKCLSTTADIILFVLIRIAIFSIITLLINDNFFLRFLMSFLNIWNLSIISSRLRNRMLVNSVWDVSNLNAHLLIAVSKIWRNERRFLKSSIRSWKPSKWKRKLHMKLRHERQRRLIGMTFEKAKKQKTKNGKIKFLSFININKKRTKIYTLIVLLYIQRFQVLTPSWLLPSLYIKSLLSLYISL